MFCLCKNFGVMISMDIIKLQSWFPMVAVFAEKACLNPFYSCLRTRMGFLQTYPYKLTTCTCLNCMCYIKTLFKISKIPQEEYTVRSNSKRKRIFKMFFFPQSKTTQPSLTKAHSLPSFSENFSILVFTNFCSPYGMQRSLFKLKVLLA